MANEPGAAAVAEQPVSTVYVDLQARREAKRDAEKAPIAEPAAPAATPAEDEPIDPELAKEVDQIAPPPATETPQEKAARTRANKERARKGLVSRLGNERDAARAELARVRQELAQHAALPAGAIPAAPSPVSQASVVDPSDPEPTYDSFLKAHPDHPDPYAGYLREQGRWDRRQETRQAAQHQRIASATSAAQQALQAYQQRVETVRQAQPNYYDVVDPFIQSRKDDPRSPYITRSILRDPEWGSRVMYQIAANRDLATLIYSQPDPDSVFEVFGAIKAELKRNATPALPAPTAAVLPPEPVRPVGGGVAPTASTGEFSLAAKRARDKAAGRKTMYWR